MNYSLSTIRRGLRNLVTQRLPALEASKAGAYYKPELLEYHVAITDLPPATTSAPFKDDLRSTDARHDSFGKVIHCVTETCFLCPDIDPAVLVAAKQVRDAFIPTLEELQSPYAAEGERATERKPLLTSLEPQLKMFHLPWDTSKTLHDIATAFLNEGQKLDELLNQRADVPKAARRQAALLRTKAMGTLSRLRKDLKKEIERDINLPRDLEQGVFGFFDTLHAMEAAGKSHEPVDGEHGSPAPTP
jgi:hypothetical protein